VLIILGLAVLPFSYEDLVWCWVSVVVQSKEQQGCEVWASWAFLHDDDVCAQENELYKEFDK
jgi:hypothetical protein